ncbi:MAG: hypothetical protein KC609_00750, partial [Myxococcales bacterium]|nr:hypothetical protein [Myxococcales bacterium]
DRNLPEIAARRVLRRKSEAARQQLEHSWNETEKIRNEVFQILLTPNADRSVFRKVYPFSPALLETLVAVSGLLQRERTALKVMLQLLVDQRDTLELGQIVPVGDLFDVISKGDEPFDEVMRIHFENAKRLYLQKLQPMLEKERGLTAEQAAALPYNDARARAYRADDRLLKTLLLAALVPQVDVLRGLNSERLAALNHGNITSPIPGRERQEVLRRIKTWASQVGEIKVGDEVDPTISLQLSGVDTATILENARVADNQGNRRRKIRELLFEQLGIEQRDEMFQEHELLWRGTRRPFQVIFGNVRELTTESLATKSGVRKAILDFPLDDPGFSPSDDLARLDTFRGGEKPARSLVWLPSFLSLSAQRDLGTLVVLDEILKSDDTFRRHASHLSAIDQQQARELLKNQRSQLRQRTIQILEGAYGAAMPLPGSVDESHTPAEHFQSLDPSFTPQPPVGATLRHAFEHLLDQMLGAQFPAHPRFGSELKTSALRKVQEEVARAAQAQDGRIPIDKPMRPLMNEIAVPLQLGEMGETHFVLGRHWYTHLNRHSEGELTVGKLRAALDLPSPMGLPANAQNLIIQLYADQTNRSFYMHGGAYSPKLEDLPDELELREQKLPSEAAWAEAIQRAGKVFGIAVSPLRNATNSSQLARALAELAGKAVDDCQAVCDRLEGVSNDFGVATNDSSRLATANAVLSLVRGLSSPSAEPVEVLAGASVATSLEAMGASYRKASSMRGALERTKWEVLASV